MAEAKKTHTLRLELWSDQGSLVGEVEATVSTEFLRGFARSAGSADGARSDAQQRESHNHDERDTGDQNDAGEERTTRSSNRTTNGSSRYHGANGAGNGTRSPNGFRSSENDAGPRRAPKPFYGRDDHPTEARGDERAMSTEQRKFLFRLAYTLGFKKDAATTKVLDTLGVERLEWATRSQASQAIDALKEEAHGRQSRGNGSAHG